MLKCAKVPTLTNRSKLVALSEYGYFCPARARSSLSATPKNGDAEYVWPDILKDFFLLSPRAKKVWMAQFWLHPKQKKS